MTDQVTRGLAPGLSPALSLGATLGACPRDCPRDRLRASPRSEPRVKQAVFLGALRSLRVLGFDSVFLRASAAPRQRFFSQTRQRGKNGGQRGLGPPDLLDVFDYRRSGMVESLPVEPLQHTAVHPDF